MGDPPLIGLVLATAGCGSRFKSSIPKQFTKLRAKPLYFHALEAFAHLAEQAVVVVPESWREEVESQVASLPYRDKLILEIGGPRRQDSVYRGLCRFSEQIELVLVHDAARPFLSEQLISRVVEGTRRHQACVPVLPVSDTLKETRSERIVRTVERESLALVQTPQGFEISLLKRAFRQAIEDNFYGTDESVLVERLNEAVHVVPGERANIKVTWPEDLSETQP